MIRLTNLQPGICKGRVITIILTILIWMVLPLSIQATVDTTSSGGDWGNASNWQDGSVPTSSDSVVIQNQIDVRDNHTSAYIKIEESPTVSSIKYVSLKDGNTLTINGDIKIDGTGTYASTLEVLGAATVDISGDIILNDGSNSKIDMQDGASTFHVEGDLNLNTDGDIVGGTESEFVFDGASQSIDVSNSTNFHDFTVNSSSVVTLNGSLSSTELGGDLVVKGGTFSNGGNSISADSTFQVQNGATFLMTGSTSLPSNMTHDIQSGAIIEYGGGTQTVEAPNNSQKYYDLKISGTGTKSLGSALTVDNNLTIASATLASDGNNLTLKGDWLNDGGSFTPGTATVILSGSSQQEIKSNGESFNDVTFDNDSNFTLNGVMTVDSSCTMTNGVVSTGNDTLVLKSTTASDLSGHGDTSFVNGYLKRYIGDNTSTYDFPVGNGTKTSNYYLAEVINNNLSGMEYLAGSYININDSEDDSISTEHISPDDTITYAQLVQTGGVWMLEPDNQPTSGDYDIKCHLENYVQNALEDNAIGIIKRPLGSSNNGANWSAAGDINAKDGDGRLKSDGYVLSKNVSSFSEFGVGGDDSTVPLPIQMLRFNARFVKDNVKLQWATASEMNNDYFAIQRSENGQNFKTIGRVDGAGNSNTKQIYSHLDTDPLSGTSYYRLKQTDENGGFSYSDIVSVNNEPSDLEIKVSPNPVQKGNSIQMKLNHMNSSESKEGKVKIYKAVTGQLVSEFELTNNKKNYQLPSNVNNGVYLIKGSIGQSSFSKKLVIQ